MVCCAFMPTGIGRGRVLGMLPQITMIANTKTMSSKREWGVLVLLRQLSFWCLWLAFCLLCSYLWVWHVHSVGSPSFSLCSVIRTCKEWLQDHSLETWIWGVIAVIPSYCNCIWIQEENFYFLYFWRKATVHVPCGWTHMKVVMS